jgi:Tfp pilus assembly protein PilF
LSGKYFTSLLVALLFAVHPLRVESVAWIAERKGVLSSSFYFFSLLFYLRYIKNGGRKFYGLSMISLLFSLLSKPIAVSQPFVLLLIDYVSGKKPDKKALLDKVPFFAIAAVFIAITYFTQKSEVSISYYSSLTTLQRICVPFYGMVFYLVKSIVPVHLCSYYSYFATYFATFDSSMNVKLFAAPFLVIGSAVAIYSCRGYSRKLVFGSLFFLITALPTLQIVPAGATIVAERYTYIPMIGIYFIFAELYGFLFNGKFRDSSAVKGIMLAGIGILIVIFTCITHERCGVWKDSLSLWSDVIGKFPCAVAYNNRGLAYDDSNYDRAIEDYTQAIMIDPNYVLPYINRGLAYKSKGNYDRAIEDYTQAIMIDPKNALAYNNRGGVYHAKGDNDRAIEDLTQAILLNPKGVQFYNNRGSAYYAKGNYDRAIHDYTQAIMLDPEYAESYYNRGLACHAKGDDGHVKKDIEKACDLGLTIACKLLQANERPVSRPER